MIIKSEDEIYQYLLPNLRLIIDEYNYQYRNLDVAELKQLVEDEFNERDIVFRLAKPFDRLARFEVSKDDGSFGTVDIGIREKNFKIEAKFLRSFLSTHGTPTNKITWEGAFEKDYKWLEQTIKDGKKGKNAFILGWFNVYDRFSQIMQIGEGKGMYPKINPNRLEKLFFLNATGDRTKDIVYDYSIVDTVYSIRIDGYTGARVNASFIGGEDDVFHFVIYW